MICCRFVAWFAESDNKEIWVRGYSLLENFFHDYRFELGFEKYAAGQILILKSRVHIRHDWFSLIYTFCTSNYFCNNLVYKMRISNDHQLSHFGLVKEIMLRPHKRQPYVNWKKLTLCTSSTPPQPFTAYCCFYSREASIFGIFVNLFQLLEHFVQFFRFVIFGHAPVSSEARYFWRTFATFSFFIGFVGLELK